MGELFIHFLIFFLKCVFWYPFYLPYLAWQKYRDHQATRELPLPTRDQSRPPTPAETAQAQTQLKIAWAVMQEATAGGFGWLGKLEQATRALNIAREMDPRAAIPGADGEGTMTLDSLSGFALYVEAYHYANDIKYGLDFQQEMHQNKRQRTALAAINKAVNYDAGRAQFWAVKARVHKNLKQRADAVTAARKAVELDYNDPDALRILGEVQ